MIYYKHSKIIGIPYNVPNAMLPLRKYEVSLMEEVIFKTERQACSTSLDSRSFSGLLKKLKEFTP